MAVSPSLPSVFVRACACRFRFLSSGTCPLLCILSQAFHLIVPHLIQLFIRPDTQVGAVTLLTRLRPSAVRRNQYGHVDLHKTHPIQATDWNHMNELLPHLALMFQDLQRVPLLLTLLNMEVCLILPFKGILRSWYGDRGAEHGVGLL